MKIRQVLYSDIPRRIFRRGIRLFLFGEKDIYFKLDHDLKDIELWKIIFPINDYPAGVYDIDALGKHNYLRVTYNPEMITEQSILDWLDGLDLSDSKIISI